MKKNVVITVRGLQRQVAEDEPVEVISAGTYLRKDDTHYLSYEEADEDGNITKNRIKITGLYRDVKAGRHHNPDDFYKRAETLCLL